MKKLKEIIKSLFSRHIKKNTVLAVANVPEGTITSKNSIVFGYNDRSLEGDFYHLDGGQWCKIKYEKAKPKTSSLL